MIVLSLQIETEFLDYVLNFWEKNVYSKMGELVQACWNDIFFQNKKDINVFTIFSLTEQRKNLEYFLIPIMFEKKKRGPVGKHRMGDAFIDCQLVRLIDAY